MFLSIGTCNFDPHHIIISERTKNNIMIGSDFHRIIFCDELIATNGLFINFTLNNIFIEKYFNKIKCIFLQSTANNEKDSKKAIGKTKKNTFLTDL